MHRSIRNCILSVLVAGGVLCVPLDAGASFLDFIFDMSGPQMIGKGARCRMPVKGGETKCDFFSIRRSGVEPDVVADKRPWVNLEGAVYTSTGKNEGNTDYEAFHTFMLSFEPMVEVASKSAGTWRLFHGAGLASHFLFGPDFRRFGNAGFKVRPVGVEIGDSWEVALNIRLYPDGFGADQFGFGPSPSGDRPFEYTWGIMAGKKFSWWP